MGFEYDATSLQMMAAGTGSSLMLSNADMGNMEHYEQIFSNVDSVQTTAANKQKKAAVQNPEVERKQHSKIAKQASVTEQDGEFEVTTILKPVSASAAAA